MSDHRWCYLMRGANEGRAENAPRHGLVRRVNESIEKTDSDGRDTGVLEGARRAAHGRVVERNIDAPVVAQPFRYFATQPAIYEHGRFVLPRSATGYGGRVANLDRCRLCLHIA
jgi:hypothetical protein